MRLILLHIFFAVQILGFAQQFTKYPFETGMIEYKLEGYSKGKQVTYWQQSGYNELTITEQETNLLGEKSISKKSVLVLGNYIYEWNFNDKYLHKSINPDVQIWQQGKFSSEDWEPFFERCMQLQGYEHVGSERVGVKTCEMYNGLQKRWYWNGLLIKTESVLLKNKQIIKASKLNTDIEIPPSIFNLPEGRILIDNTRGKLEKLYDKVEEYDPAKLKDNLDKLFKKE